MATNINTILSWFKTGLKPTQEQFWNSWTSFWHKDEKIPQSSISGLETVLNAKAEKEQLEAHYVDSNAHAAQFLTKEDKAQKGIAGGYAPLDEFTKLASQYLNIVDDLFTGGSTSILSAQQGVVLQNQIDGINTLLSSDNINLDTIQEIVDAIENVESYLATILVNDLTTGGVTKALTAEMGKVLQNTKLTATLATDAETQIIAVVPEDSKVVSRLKLFNWWTWIKTQVQIISADWRFDGSLKFGFSGYFTSDSARFYIRALTGKQLNIGVEGIGNDSIIINSSGVQIVHKVTLPVGTATTPPLILPKGVLTTTPQDGAIEADPNNLYYTDGVVRYPILSKYLYNGSSQQFIKWIYTNTAPGTFSEEILQFPTPEQSWFTLGGPRILMKADFFIDRNYYNTSFKLTKIRIVLVSANKSLTVNVGTVNVVNGNGNIILPMEWDFSLLQRGYSFYLVCKYKNYTELTSTGAGKEETMMARLDGYSTSYDWGNVAWNLKFYIDYAVEASPAANDQVFIAHLLTRRVRTIL